MRLIDADKVLAEFPVRRNYHDEKHGNMHFINGIETVMEYLDEIADTFPIDAEPVRHGRWLDSGINGTVSCSLCKFTDFFANSACNCTFDCNNCFNQHIKKLRTITKSSKEIIAEVQSNVFNQGIIFAGLEWTLQLDECILLAAEAKKHELLTMVYTGNVWESSVVKRIIKSHVFDYIKCGQYDETLKTANHIEYGIVLASSNQHIYKRGVDYA